MASELEWMLSQLPVKEPRLYMPAEHPKHGSIVMTSFCVYGSVPWTWLGFFNNQSMYSLDMWPAASWNTVAGFSGVMADMPKAFLLQM